MWLHTDPHPQPFSRKREKRDIGILIYATHQPIIKKQPRNLGCFITIALIKHALVVLVALVLVLALGLEGNKK